MSEAHKYEPLTKESWAEFLDNMPPQPKKKPYNPFRTKVIWDAWKEACEEFTKREKIIIEGRR